MSITKKETMNYLEEKGFKHSLLGYEYIIKAAELVDGDRQYARNIVKGLYPAVAKEFDTTASRDERAIRHSIEISAAFAHGFKPTNSEFIVKLVDDIRYSHEE